MRVGVGLRQIIEYGFAINSTFLYLPLQCNTYYHHRVPFANASAALKIRGDGDGTFDVIMYLLCWSMRELFGR